MLRLSALSILPKGNLLPTRHSFACKTFKTSSVALHSNHFTFQPICIKNVTKQSILSIFAIQTRGIYTTREMIRRRKILEKLREASIQQDMLPYDEGEEDVEDDDEGVEEKKTEEEIKLETFPAIPPEDEDYIDTIDAVSDYSTERAVRENLNKAREFKKLFKEQKLDEEGEKRKQFLKAESRREQELLKELTNLHPGQFEHENIEELTRRASQVETSFTRKAEVPKLRSTPEIHQFSSEKEKEEFLKTMDEVVQTLPEEDGLTDEERTEFTTAIIQMNPALARLDAVLKTRNFPEKKYQQLILAFVQTYDSTKPKAPVEQSIPVSTENLDFGVRDIVHSEEEFFLPSELLLRSQVIATGAEIAEDGAPALCRFCVEGTHYFDAMNVPLLTRFMTKSGRIIPRKYTGLCGSHQRKVSKTIKLARHVGIFSYKKGDFQIHSPFSTM